jgi:hypothetical protein
MRIYGKNAQTIDRVEEVVPLSGAIYPSNQTDRFSGYADLECYLAICVDTRIILLGCGKKTGM